MCRAVERHNFCPAWVEGELAWHRWLTYLVEVPGLRLRSFPGVSCVGQESEDRSCRGLTGIFPGPGRQMKNISSARKCFWGDHPSYGTHIFWSLPKCPLSKGPSLIPNSTVAPPTHSVPCPRYFSSELVYCAWHRTLIDRNATSLRAEKLAVPLQPCPRDQSSALHAGEITNISFSIRAWWNSSSIPGKPVTSTTWGLPVFLH